MGGARKLGSVALAGLFVSFGLALVPGSAHATTLATFSARGSVGQVSVTHAPPGDTLALEDAAHAVVATGTVDDLGSFLFRNVAAGTNYMVVDGDQVTFPFDVMTADATPPQSFYDAPTPRRRVPIHHDPRRNAAERRGDPAGSGRPGSVSHGHRVLGLRPLAPGQAATQHADRPAARLRDRRREHPRHRVLRGRVRLLRTAAATRRLRRGGSGRRAAVGPERHARHGRHLVSRYRPDLRRADPAAAPRRDRRAVGRGRHVSQPRRSRWHPERRFPTGVGAGTRRRREAVRTRLGTAGRRRRRLGRTTVRGEPTAAAPEREPGFASSTRTPTASRSPGPTRSHPRSSHRRSTCRCSWAARGRTNRPAVSRL